MRGDPRDERLAGPGGVSLRRGRTPGAGSILFRDDVNEPPYKVNCTLNHLRLAGKLSKREGMIVGKLARCEPEARKPSLPMKGILLDATREASYPIVTAFPARHVRPKKTLLLGVSASLNTAYRKLVLQADVPRP